ncbi:MAG: hypothetical protein EPO68_18310 [Planctomycetota bacterium]|nr:MAG: hypothetical protein EPO68_18310 [Planctomycetota bacterium]
MSLPLLFALALLSIATPAQSSSELPVLRADSDRLDYELDGVLHAQDWHVVPELALDTYDLPRSTRAQRIVFRSGVDSLELVVAPGEERDFIVRLAGRGDCRTRVSARRRSAQRLHGDGASAVDLPCELGSDGRLYLTGRIGASQPLKLMFDTGANALVVFRSGRAKLRDVSFDAGAIDNASAGGSARRAVADGQRLEIGALAWPYERVLEFDQEHPDCDGICGYDLFADKVLELDAAGPLVRMHELAPAESASAARLELRWQGALHALPVELELAGARVTAWPVFDTGAVAGLYLCAGFSARSGLPGELRVLGSSRSWGLGPRPIDCTTVEVPRVALGAHALERMPVHVGTDAGSDHVAEGLLGMDVLKRYRMWIDYPRRELRVLPNALFAQPFRTDYDDGKWRWFAGAGVALAVLCVALVLRRRRASRAG